MNHERAKCSISVISYTALEHAKRCIASVLANRAGAQLILTAQGNPCAVNWFRGVARDNPNVAVIVKPKNRGFIEPSNDALKVADSEYHVLLNDDCAVSPGWLEALERPFTAFPACALSAPVGGHFPRSLNPDKTAVEYLFGWCLMGRTALLKEVGLFSDYLKFAYWEEIDLGFRLIARGHTLHVAPDCKVAHVGKATSRNVHSIRQIEQRNYREVTSRFPQYFGR